MGYGRGGAAAWWRGVAAAWPRFEFVSRDKRQSDDTWGQERVPLYCG
jgi:hypothetical protein